MPFRLAVLLVATAAVALLLTPALRIRIGLPLALGGLLAALFGVAHLLTQLHTASAASAVPGALGFATLGVALTAAARTIRPASGGAASRPESFETARVCLLASGAVAAALSAGTFLVESRSGGNLAEWTSGGLLLLCACAVLLLRGVAPIEVRFVTIVGTFAALVAVRAVEPDRLGWPSSVGLLALSAGVAASAMTLLAWRHWSYRRWAWLADPRSLLDPPPRPAWVAVGVSLPLVIAALSGVLAAAHPTTPILLAVGCVTAFSALARYSHPGFGALGAVLGAQAVALAPVAWIQSSDAATAGGLGLASLWLLWLARFWDQQLLEGQPWTTSAGLIPTARATGIALSVCALIAAIPGVCAAGESSSPTAAVLAGLVLLGASLHWSRDAGDHGTNPATFASAVFALAAASVLAPTVAPPGTISVPIAAAGGSLLWGLVLTRRRAIARILVAQAFRGALAAAAAMLASLWLDLPAGFAACLAMTVLGVWLARCGESPRVVGYSANAI